MKKYLFIDRDGTLLIEPEDKQIDDINKFALFPGVIPALLQLQNVGYFLVMISNQDGLGTERFPQADFDLLQQLMMNILTSQGIQFEAIRICPHLPENQCDCRKPKVGLIFDYLKERKFDRECSYVIGDRDTDLQLAENMGIQGIKIGSDSTPNWQSIIKHVLYRARKTQLTRTTKETVVTVEVNLDQQEEISIDTGLGFFNHMLEQLAKHGGFSLKVKVSGDLHIDEHHSVEDTALTLGHALRKALGDKLGINRFGFLLPMDESEAKISLDLSGRPYFNFEGKFKRERVGDLPTELVPHFFHSLAESLGATLHIQVKGKNTHHMIEAMFKGTGRVLRDAIQKNGYSLPSTKGIL